MIGFKAVESTDALFGTDGTNGLMNLLCQGQRVIVK